MDKVQIPPRFDTDELVIGIATGLVMSRSAVDEREATELLIAATERTGRDLVDVATCYVRTGYI